MLSIKKMQVILVKEQPLKYFSTIFETRVKIEFSLNNFKSLKCFYSHLPDFKSR